jgi:hypothetical protein
MCNWLFENSGRNQAIQIQWFASELEIEQDCDGVSENLTNQAMLRMPEIAHPNARDSKALSELRTDRLNNLAPPTTNTQPGAGLGPGHILACWHDALDALPLDIERLAERIPEAFIGRYQACKAFDQRARVIDIVWARQEQRSSRNHPAPADTQTKLEGVVSELFRRAMAVISRFAQAPITLGTCVSADRQRQSINWLCWITILSAHTDEPLLEARFNLPQVGGLPDKERALS